MSDLAGAKASDAPLSTAVDQDALGKEKAREYGWRDAAITGRTVTVNRPRNEVYAFWRDVTNYARFMENIESVHVIDDTRSHWVVKAPAGRTVEWDAVIIADEPGRRIAWESTPGADIKNKGEIEFHDAPAGRGTYVTATLAYDPPAGDLGKLVAKLFRREPKVQARQDMRRFKQYIETGEISTTQPGPAAPRSE